MSEELFKAEKNKPGEAAALSCQSSVRLQRAMGGTSPQLQLAEEKEEKVKAVKKRQEPLRIRFNSTYRTHFTPIWMNNIVFSFKNRC